MTIADPQVWGPLLISASVYFGCNRAVSQLRWMEVRRSQDAGAITQALDSLGNDLSQCIRMLEMIQYNTEDNEPATYD